MKSIALVDWSWVGHHPMYFRQLLLGFRASGVQVLAMCPEDTISEMSEWLEAQPNSLELLDFVEFQPVRHLREWRFLPDFLRGRVQGLRMFGTLSNSIRKWELQTGNRISLVFFATIYDYHFRNFHHARRVFRYPWSGIHLHSLAFRTPMTPVSPTNCLPCPEKFLSDPSMKSICVLDEGAIEHTHVLCKGKPVFEFPDITATETEDPFSGGTLAAKLLGFANGRKIVVCLGHLKKTKGILELCLAARDPRLQDVFFFFGGEVDWTGMSRQEVETITKTWEQSPNVLIHTIRITDDSAINGVILAADVVYAAYTNFPNSSNMMTKAAFFERPIIVSDGFLMAERVEAHQTGKVVPEGDVSAIVSAILDLTSRKPSRTEGYRNFYAKHSNEVLLQVLQKVID
jgi:glycosyltransferase involved in cell wall biosynthesis